MSDASLLFLVLAVLYGWECTCWLRRGSVACVTWFGKYWRVAHPGEFFGNQQGGFVFAWPLPPLGTILTGNQLPLSFSPQGVLTWVATSVNPNGRPQQIVNFFPFSEITSVKAQGRKLIINCQPTKATPSPRPNGERVGVRGTELENQNLLTPALSSLGGGEGVEKLLSQLALKTSSPTFAAHLAQQLERLKSLPVEKRTAAIEEIFRDSLDTKAIENLWREFQERARPVRWLANALLLYLFAFTPAMIWNFGLKTTWLSLLIGLFTLTIAIGLFFRRVHKKFFPTADDERFTHTIIVGLAPVSAMRAHDVLSRPLLETFHPLAVARVFCREENFREFAAKILRDLRHPFQPACPGDNAAWQEAESFSRTALQRAVEKFLKQNKIDPEDLCRAPKPADETCRSYCPRCQAQFTTTDGQCADCGGLPLVDFKKQAGIPFARCRS
jgi:hypothetical protein